MVGATLYVAADTPVCDSRGVQPGVAVVADPVDRPFLAQHVPDPGVDLAVVTNKQVFATSGSLAPTAIPGSVVLPTGPDGSSVTRAVGDRYVGAAVISASTETGAKVSAYLLLRDRTNAVLSTRDQLFRTLFLIAFGGTVLALGLAVFTGDRITAGVRRLTRAAAGIAAGDASLRAGVGGDDEVGALGSAFDAMVDSVTAQSVALQHAAEDEARLRNRLEAVVAGMNDALVAVDPAGRITEFNQAAAALTGVPADQALGARFAKVVRLIDDDGAPVPTRRLGTGARTPARSARVLGGDGPTPVAVSSGALRGPSGEAVGTVVVLRDIRLEQEVEQMKTEFLSRIGHELRTPLTGILGYAVVTADGRWMTLAVDELIDNSVKFSPEGGRIVIRVAPGADSVEVSVADQGMGMTARHREELFGDFVQGGQLRYPSLRRPGPRSGGGEAGGGRPRRDHRGPFRAGARHHRHVDAAGGPGRGPTAGGPRRSGRAGPGITHCGG